GARRVCRFCLLAREPWRVPCLLFPAWRHRPCFPCRGPFRGRYLPFDGRRSLACLLSRGLCRACLIARQSSTSERPCPLPCGPSPFPCLLSHGPSRRAILLFRVSSP